MKKVLISAGVILLVVLIVALNFRASGGPNPEVTVASVQRRTIRAIVKAEGETRARNQVEISSDVMGKIIRIPYREGDRVKKGDTLCVIDPSTYKARVQALEARLQADLIRLQKAESDFKRQEELFKQGLIAKAAYEEAWTTYQSLKHQVAQDSFSLQEALEDLRKTVITSPVDGEVVAVNKEEGETAVVGTINTPGTVILVVADLSQMLVKAEVDETEVIRVHPGQRVRVKVDAYPDSVFPGVVERIGGVPKSVSAGGGEQVVVYPVEIRILRNAPLLPGMTASCEIVVEEKTDVLAVPFGAVGRRKVGDKPHDVVFAVHGNRAQMVPVTLGVSDERFVEVQGEISEGDTVITGPYSVLRELKDGARVKIKPQEFAGQRERGRRGRRAD